jgi:hypothetical protein
VGRAPDPDDRIAERTDEGIIDGRAKTMSGTVSFATGHAEVVWTIHQLVDAPAAFLRGLVQIRSTTGNTARDGPEDEIV